MSQPRVPGNDYGVLDPPPIGEWTPILRVSVVIPAYGHQDKLDLTLAALAGQCYPSDLMEVIVVDDGSDPPLRLPEIVPDNTRLVTSPTGGWGSAHARAHGANLATGEVLHWLDADMVPYREHVEAQMRWHHLADHLVVIGDLRFVDFTPGSPAQREVADAVAAGAAEKLFDIEQSAVRENYEAVFEETRDLRDKKVNVYSAHVGATGSVVAEFLREAGGIDTSLRLGSDTEMGYRLAQVGAVFVLEREARSWHLGLSRMVQRGDEVRRHNTPFIAHRIPYPRPRRGLSRRQWLVPMVEVVVDATAARYEDVRATVDGVLGSELADLRVTVTGPWSALSEERRDLLDDPNLDAHLIHACYQFDSRVRMLDSAPAIVAPTPFRFHCPPGWYPEPRGLELLTRRADRDGFGLIKIWLDGSWARLERTSAFSRARRSLRDGENLDDVVEETFGTLWLDGAEWGFVSIPKDYQDTTGLPPIKASRGDWLEDPAMWKRVAERWMHDAYAHKAATAKAEAETAMWKRVAERWRREAKRRTLMGFLGRVRRGLGRRFPILGRTRRAVSRRLGGSAGRRT